MSQIFTGNGLGINGSSIDALGGYGASGDASLGQANELLYINASNGNLVLRQNDGFLADHDLGQNLVHSYNSQGKSSQGQWSFNVATRIQDLTGYGEFGGGLPDLRLAGAAVSLIVEVAFQRCNSVVRLVNHPVERGERSLPVGRANCLLLRVGNATRVILYDFTDCNPDFGIRAVPVFVKDRQRGRAHLFEFLLCRRSYF